MASRNKPAQDLVAEVISYLEFFAAWPWLVLAVAHCNNDFSYLLLTSWRCRDL